MSKDKDEIVRILVDEPLEMARHTIYWDGKNHKEQYVTPGTYYARLYNNVQPDDQESMLVQEGGTPEANFEGEPIEFGSLGIFEIESIEPDTFKVKEGTNITFIIDDRAAGRTVRLVIRNKK
ncbi:MAG: hypothetical protein R6V04_13465 [bacterium]